MNTTRPTTAPHDRDARLVRNLLALRTVLAMEQMQTGRCGERIEEIDQALAKLGHDMKSTAACAADGLRRTFLLPRLIQRGNRRGLRAGTARDGAREARRREAGPRA